jgi:hypothetical protein
MRLIGMRKNQEGICAIRRPQINWSRRAARAQKVVKAARRTTEAQDTKHELQDVRLESALEKTEEIAARDWHEWALAQQLERALDNNNDC